MRQNLRSQSITNQKETSVSPSHSQSTISIQSQKIKKNQNKKYPSYKQYSKLNKHYRFINEEQNKCPICQKEFSDIYTMKTHLKGVHNLNPHLCKGCSQSFKNVKELKDHIEYTHIPKKQNCNKQGIYGSEMTPQSLVKIEENNYSCETFDHFCEDTNDTQVYNGIEIVKLLGGQVIKKNQKQNQNAKFNIFNFYGYGPECKIASYKSQQIQQQGNIINQQQQKRQQYQEFLENFYTSK